LPFSRYQPSFAPFVPKYFFCAPLFLVVLCLLLELSVVKHLAQPFALRRLSSPMEVLANLVERLLIIIVPESAVQCSISCLEHYCRFSLSSNLAFIHSLWASVWQALLLYIWLWPLRQTPSVSVFLYQSSLVPCSNLQVVLLRLFAFPAFSFVLPLFLSMLIFFWPILLPFFVLLSFTPLFYVFQRLLDILLF
jgi:hypothetical protein